MRGKEEGALRHRSLSARGSILYYSLPPLTLFRPRAHQSTPLMSRLPSFNNMLGINLDV